MAEPAEQIDGEIFSLSPEEAEDAITSFGKTASKSPGRLRMRLQPEMRTPEAMTQIKAQLEQDERVQKVTINERTGSLMINHAPENDGHQLLHKALQETELVTEAVFEVPGEEEESGEEPSGKLDQQLADVAYAVDKAIYTRTGKRLHAGLLIPGSVAGVGIAQIAILGISLELLPGPVLLWIAYDIYRRIGKEPPYQQRERANAAPDAVIAADDGDSIAQVDKIIGVAPSPA